MNNFEKATVEQISELLPYDNCTDNEFRESMQDIHEVTAEWAKPQLQPTDEEIEKWADQYCSELDFADDKVLSEKGRTKVQEWAKRDYVSGAKAVRDGMIKELKPEEGKP